MGGHDHGAMRPCTDAEAETMVRCALVSALSTLDLACSAASAVCSSGISLRAAVAVPRRAFSNSLGSWLLPDKHHAGSVDQTRVARRRLSLRGRRAARTIDDVLCAYFHISK